MNADTENPRFPGRELARWTGCQMRQLGKTVLHVIDRIRSIPKRRRITLLTIVGMVILAFVVGGIVGFLLLNPILWGGVFALITIIWAVISVATANNLKLLLSRAKRADSDQTISSGLLLTIEGWNHRMRNVGRMIPWQEGDFG